MALPSNLNTNEVKNASGTEVEFNRFGIDSLGRLVFRASSETPNLPNRLYIAHREVGEGINRRRESNITFRKTCAGVDTLATPVENVISLSLRFAVGNSDDTDEPQELLAYMMSFIASLGASTTILYDGTGNGASTLINGTF